MTTLDIHHVRVTHRGTPLVEVSDLSLEAGRAFTIVGESGSGKSLLAHAVMGTLAAGLAVEGAMSLDGRRIDLADPGNRRALWGRELALLPQEPASALDPTMRVGAQVAEGMLEQTPRRERLALAEAALAGVGLAGRGRDYPHTLSGGMAQRVTYAAATIGGARVLLLDEPSKGLDRRAVDQLGDLLDRHLADGGLLLTITHDLRLASRLGGTVAVMREAAIIESGPVDRVLGDPQADYTRRLVGADPARWDRPWQRAGVVPERSAPPLVVATDVGKSYGDAVVLDAVSLEVGAGERVALVGPSGSGKTTLGNALLRLVPVDRGTVTHAAELSGGRVQKLYQDPALSFPAHVPLGAGIGDVARRHGVDPGRVDELLVAMGLAPELMQRRPGQVSGGELQRIAVVRAMLPAPALVFADEATSRLDLLTQELTVDCLMTELAARDCALLMITHDEALAEAVADRRIALGKAGSREKTAVPS
ncbi:ABC transporter ATP-binding protein [Nocardioides gansuensis]|uniref:ABC transporter ATP-binding protein n=1 Tax=Nocardioides gansuensis TaxID=2138300 RepID=A0A2T8F5G6_9ACTN|nr:ATP-binding cassette domain-containing protein [Nocardioides gansuensis]PVG80946.1 ABC transporter ATP-binding protein [Nocardioides gansuensis]